MHRCSYIGRSVLALKNLPCTSPASFYSTLSESNSRQRGWKTGGRGRNFLALGAAVATVSGFFALHKNFFFSVQGNEKEEKNDKKRNESLEYGTLKGAEELEVEEAVLTFAPNVPPPLSRKHPVRLRVTLTSRVETVQVDGPLNYVGWTFDGKIPGPFIRARVGDVLEVEHVNKDPSGMAHNVDFHAAHCTGGGAKALSAGKDERSCAAFKLMSPGVYVYHCAVDPVSVHISNGMYGLMLVEPEEGLAPVDKEYYVLQSEFYTSDPVKGQKTLDFDYQRGIDEKPSYVVFNGRTGSLLEEGSLTAKAGEKVRIFFGNIGPNLVSSFHIIGVIMDKVYREGDLISPPGRMIQTTLVPSGGATMVEFTPQVPGTYTLLDHSIFRTEKGAVGFLKVSGEKRDDLYKGNEDNPACKSCRTHL